MSDINNLYNNLTNFYNVNDENFKEFMAKLYDEMLANHRDVKYVKEHYIEEIEKKLKEYIIDDKLNIKIDRNIYSELKKKANLNEVITKGNVDLNEMTERTLQAIQGGGGTSFELLSVPRDNSVNISKLDESIKNTLYSSTIFDDSQVERKGTVGGSDLYIINNNFKDCIINSITLSCLDFATGEVRIYEKNGDIVTLVKTISFDTRVIGTNKPKIDVNYKVNNGYIGFTRGEGSIDFGTRNTFGFLNCSGKKAEQSFNITEAALFDNFSMKVLIETNKVKINNNNSYITVDKNGNGDYTSIQEAINNYNGIPIFVRNGVYEEGRLECSDKNITIIGEN